LEYPQEILEIEEEEVVVEALLHLQEEILDLLQLLYQEEILNHPVEALEEGEIWELEEGELTGSS
jgi:hypothetical protein